jgi:methionyl-tRNA formyltransferase
MRLVFAGTPAAAVPSLDALLKSRHEVAAVITRPDAPAGRGRRVGPSPVAERAAEVGLELLKPATPRDEGFLQRMRALAPDCCPVTAYGALIPQAALEIPARMGEPAFRPASLAGRRRAHQRRRHHRATTFRLVAELTPTGLRRGDRPIGEQDTAADLLARFTNPAPARGSPPDGIETGRVATAATDGAVMRPADPEDARVCWNTPAHAVTAGPRLHTRSRCVDRVRGHPAEARRPGRPAGPGHPGSRPRLRSARGAVGGKAAVFAGTATGPVELGDVQPPGKRRMGAAEWARGLRLESAGAGRVPLVFS